MATPDLRSLNELYRQMYGSQCGALAPARAEEEAQYPGRASTRQWEAPVTNGNYVPTGGVLSGLVAPPTSIPQWMQGFMPAGGVLRAPVSTAPFGLGRSFPMPTGSNPVVEIPNPHLERFVPESTRNFWTAATLLPWILGRGMLGMTTRMEAPKNRMRPHRPSRRLGSPQMVVAISRRRLWGSQAWRKRGDDNRLQATRN
jgi:hypothetical protein